MEEVIQVVDMKIYLIFIDCLKKKYKMTPLMYREKSREI